MSEGIYLIQEDGKMVEMKNRLYDSEDKLQSMLEKYPNLLPGDQINNTDPRRWLLITREAAIPSEEDGGDRWSVDHLFLDQDAIPTLVEVKRSTDTRIRREVVGQMLDYASNAVLYWPVEKIKYMFETNCQNNKENPEEKLSVFLDETKESDEFWNDLKTNLQLGRIRMLFVADEIPPELRRVVEFLNEQMDPAEVLAIEVRQFVTGKMRVIVPGIYGQTELTKQKKSSSSKVGKQWNETRFFEEMSEKFEENENNAVKKIYEWSIKNKFRIKWGKGKQDGSFYPFLDKNNKSHHLFVVWTYGTVEVPFEHMKKEPPFDDDFKRKELLGKLNNLPNIDLSEDKIHIRPGIKLSVFKNQKLIDDFLDIWDWFVDEIKRY